MDIANHFKPEKTVNRRRAFTLIEILTVVAILAILISIVAYGLSKVTTGTKAAATKITLQNLRSMISEFEVTAKGLSRQPGGMYATNGTLIVPPAPYDIWRDGDPTDGVALPEPDAAFAPGDVKIEMVSDPTPNFGRYNGTQIGNTQLAISTLLTSSNNRKTIQQLPPTQLLEAVPASTKVRPLTGGRPDPPLVLDAWGNPIIFVPVGGLCGDGSGAGGKLAMWIGGKPGDTDASEVIATATASSGAQIKPIQSPDRRPFWASAGPDGNFCTGDDNIYSFQE